MKARGASVFQGTAPPQHSAEPPNAGWRRCREVRSLHEQVPHGGLQRGHPGNGMNPDWELWHGQLPAWVTTQGIVQGRKESRGSLLSGKDSPVTLERVNAGSLRLSYQI